LKVNFLSKKKPMNKSSDAGDVIPTLTQNMKCDIIS